MGPEWRKEEVLYHQAKQSRWRSLSHWGGGKAWAFRCHPPVGSLRAILCVIVATIFGNPYRFFWPICASITIDNLNSQTLTTMAAPGDVEKPQAASVQCPDSSSNGDRGLPGGITIECQKSGPGGHRSFRDRPRLLLVGPISRSTQFRGYYAVPY